MPEVPHSVIFNLTSYISEFIDNGLKLTIKYYFLICVSVQFHLRRSFCCNNIFNNIQTSKCLSSLFICAVLLSSHLDHEYIHSNNKNKYEYIIYWYGYVDDILFLYKGNI